MPARSAPARGTRHGVCGRLAARDGGNSPLHAGFAVAAATWIWSERESPASRGSRIGLALLALLAAIAVTLTAVSLDSTTVVVSFEQSAMLAARDAAPRRGPDARGGPLHARDVERLRDRQPRRALASIAPPARARSHLTAGLVAIRPWTVDDFTAMWGRRSLEGDPVAIGSLVAVPVLAIVLVARERVRRLR
jgi:hypothetical protein